MDLNTIIENAIKRGEEDRREAANHLAADMLSIISEGGEPIFETPPEDKMPNRKPLPLTPLSSFPEYVPEEENQNILIKGRWLERGGSAWWISTAGTGKSIASLQLAMLWSEGLPFAGLTPNGHPLIIWIIQSEDSPSRVTIDREDIIAELSEQYEKIDWREAAKKVKFVSVGPHVGADFLARLDSILDRVMRDPDEKMPDVVIMNPFLAYIGGPVTDGSFVTPFLRGGEINRKPTVGLQAILERYDISTLIFHHTPKPPTEKELDAWMKSAFPEYQGAGSSDITNWGRSFITMMKVKEDPYKVVLTAGKNGGEIGWQTIDGATRHFLARSDGIGITGRARHAWRELDERELSDVSEKMSQQKIIGNGRPAKEDLDIEKCASSISSNYHSEAVGKLQSVFAEHFWKKEGKAHRKSDYFNVFDVIIGYAENYGFGTMEIVGGNGKKNTVLTDL